MRSLKDEHAQQKQQNSALQSELDALRNSTEASLRTSVVDGRITPLSDDSDEHTTHTQSPADAARQLRRATAENSELHEKVTALQTEVEELRESLAASQRESNVRVQQVEDLETEMDRLEAALEAARDQSQMSPLDVFAEQFDFDQGDAGQKRENHLLQQRIDAMQQRNGILLDM